MWHNRAIPYEADFSLNGSLGELDRLTAEVERFCAAHSLNEDAVFDLNLVLEELFVNAVRHGGCEGLANAARVRMRLVNGVEVEYTACGRPFDLTQAPEFDVRASLEQRRAGGMGVHLVRKIMRDLQYSRQNEGNRIVMRWEESQ
jgi:anti-sigma regulatory factor (Ser/Thr protein kinase)